MAPIIIEKKLPASTTPEAVIAVLHDHEQMIKCLSPQYIDSKLDEGDPATKATYSVTDKKPIGTTTYKLTLTNHADGVDTLVNAKPPVGTLTISGKWRVVDGTLKEEAEIDGNMLTKKMATGNLNKTHPEAMDLIFQNAAKTG
ncbi:hypothetical protein K402DRAFT_389063 [Aulographum hederae CBS 113979]|uniref:DUF7053 domain-containing protein n=1 Tax=Aulographum hederae CBS 113979 TaxID=1176131 RepID=A0A6G1HF48_9PEZI|nr:hypothetical protein K402DRAFT_389063 [Aulographum hederae CBS 113979]